MMKELGLKSYLGKHMLVLFCLVLAINVIAENKVLIPGIDGCKPNYLLNAKAPNLDAFWKNGAYSLSVNTDAIISNGICWTGILTRVWREKHNVVSNDYVYPNIAEYPYFFHCVKDQRLDLKLYSMENWNPIHKVLQDGDADIPNNLLPEDKVTKRVVDVFKNHNSDVIFVQLDEMDGPSYKHDYISESLPYLRAIEKTDYQVGKIIKAIKKRKIEF